MGLPPVPAVWFQAFTLGVTERELQKSEARIAALMETQP